MSRAQRLETFLVVLIVVFAAFYTRAEWIPAGAERHVEMAGERFDIDVGEPNRWFSAWSIGDGQAFAVIAADPSGMKLSREVREPGYRFSRAGFGWLSALLSLGQEPWIPYGMFVTGALSLLGVLWLTLHLRERLGPKALILILNPALYIGFAGDTAEPLGVLLLALAFAFGWLWAAFALGVTRPSMLVAFVGRWRQLAAAAAAYVLLSAYSFLRFGADKFLPDRPSLGVPLSGYIENPTPAGWALAVAAAITVVIGLRHRNWAWMVSGLLILSLNEFVTASPVNAWRAAGLLPVLWAFGPSYEIKDSLSPVSSRSPATA